MLLTTTNTSPPATDLSYLLVKHPHRMQSFEASLGTIRVLYSQAIHQCCTAALPDRYVNDRPYVA